MDSITFVIVGFIAGVTAGVVTQVAPGDALAAALAAAALACLMPSRRLATVCLVAACLGAAAAHGAAARHRALYPPLLVEFDRRAGDADRLPSPIAIDGVLAEDAAITPSDDGVRLVIDVLTIEDEAGGRRQARGRIHAHVAGTQGAGRVREWTAGRRVRAPVSLRRPQMLLNFGGPSPFWQRLQRPFVLTGSIKSAALVEVERGGWWAEAASRARWRVRDAVGRFVAPRDPQAAGVIAAILIGDRAGLDDRVERRLQMAGTYHVIAISGGNVALLAVLCYAVLRLVFRSSRVVSALTLVVTICYGATVGGDPSVARAVTAASIYLAAGTLGLAPSPSAVLRTTAGFLALVDPLIVIDAGAWLSFGATLGILLLTTRMVSVVPWRRVPDVPSRILRPIALLVASTLAAEIVLLPISAGVFARVTFAGIALNLVAIPAMAGAQLCGMVVAVFGPALALVGEVAGRAAAFLGHLLLATSALTDVWPWLTWRVPVVSAVSVGTYYASVWIAARPGLARRKRGLAAGLAGLCLLWIVTAPATSRAAPPAGRLRVSVLDVGQGDAILVQLPTGASLLVDSGGSLGGFDVGARVVSPSLWRLGVRTLTWAALTHGDADHLGGMFSVAEDLSPREVWEGVPVPRDKGLQRLRDLTRDRGIAWRSVRAGALLNVGPVQIEALHPAEPDWERQRVRNDDSLVLRIRYGRVDMLLTGDAGAEFEQRLPPDLSLAPIRILKAGHHGSRTSTSDDFVRILRPQIAVISVGRANLFGHPAPDVLARLTSAGARIYRTDRDGAVSVETDGEAVRVRTASGASWSLSVRGPS